jgi:hypothetical protein
VLWGTESHLRELFGDRITGLDVTQRTFTFRFPSAEQFVAFFRIFYGPTLKAFAALNDVARDSLESDLIELAERHDRLHGDAIALPATYAEAIAVKR